ncbi:MAG: alpha/beta fold hydrolase [Acidobacteriota bacterium]|nr:alpha/beta fold hydrolase [Acidobacteriota bacterium]MDQ2979556.1 alpha/beta fold hydrolase [Acidobacteriota bacterium]
MRELLEPRGMRVIAPDLNIPSFQRLDFRAMARISFWEAKKHMPAVVVGSSLGALVALELSRSAPVPALVLIAPALGFGARWVEKLSPGDPLSFFHFGQGRDLPIHRRFFEQMARLELESEPPRVPTAALIGTDDESVPFGAVQEVWSAWERSGALPPGSKFVAIPGGDHGLLEHVPRIADEIVAMDAARGASANREAGSARRKNGETGRP